MSKKLSNDSPYFESESFGKVLEFLKNNFNNSEMKENNSKLSFSVKNIVSVSDAINICNKIILLKIWEININKSY